MWTQNFQLFYLCPVEMIWRNTKAYLSTIKFLVEERNTFIQHSQNYGCWWPGTAVRHCPVSRVKQCTFQWLISNDISHKEMVFNGWVIHHLIMITCISYEIIFTISLPKLIDIAPRKTCVIHVTDSVRHCNTDYSGLEWSNINTFWYWCGKYIFIADAGNYNWMLNY